jgi:uncharacterized protein (TIGR02001 family)
MNNFKTALLAVSATVAMSGAAYAQDETKPVALSFNVGGASDYVFRGISQTNEEGQVFGGADATILGIGYAGAWVSNVDFGKGNSTDLEFDLYGGVKPKLGPVQLDLGVIYYGYTDQPHGSDEDYVEFKAAGSVPVGPATVGAAVYYSDDFFGGTGRATYYELNGSAPIAKKFTVSGAVGHQEVRGPADYNTWNLGVGYAINDHVGIDVRYHDTDEHSLLGDIGDARGVVGLKVSW